MRPGSGTRPDAVGTSSLIMCPRNTGSSTPPDRSVSAERGLANWPAILPTFTTGTPEP